MGLLSSNITTVTKGALTARPMTPDEIDRHPDAARIWATIFQMRLDFAAALDHVEHAKSHVECRNCGMPVPVGPIFDQVENLL